MTREELIEVMARAICLRELIIRNASTQRERDYDDDELRAIAEHEWVEWVTGATDALAALEASGVRLVPVDPDDNQLAAGLESDSIVHPWEALGVYRMMVSYSPYAK